MVGGIYHVDAAPISCVSVKNTLPLACDLFLCPPRFVSPVQKMRYGIAWRKGSVEEVVARFVQYVMQQFGSK